MVFDTKLRIHGNMEASLEDPLYVHPAAGRARCAAVYERRRMPVLN